MSNVFDLPYWQDLDRPRADLHALNEKILLAEKRGQNCQGLRDMRHELALFLDVAERRARGEQVYIPPKSFKRRSR